MLALLDALFHREAEPMTFDRIFAAQDTTLEEADLSSLTAKRRGKIAEAAFMAKASRLGFAISKPWGDSESYDFITDSRLLLRRIQVKAAFAEGEDGSYSLRTHDHHGRPYDPSQIDCLVGLVHPQDAWYIFPVGLIQHLRTVKLFPNTRRKRSKFERFRDAWRLLRGRGRKKQTR